MQGKRKRITIFILFALTLVLASTLGTYAYFMTNLGREEKQELTVTTGTLALVFEDNSDGINANLSLGESITKEFKIKNTGTRDVTTNLLFNDMINTYMEESLSYRLEYKTEADGEWMPVETVSTNVPQSETLKDKNLARDITIPVDETYYYKLTITFNDLDINQNSDIDAIFASKFKIGDAIDPSKEKLKKLILTVNEGTPNFADPATTDEGVYAMEDDYGTSYYYRGAVENNYIKFGDFYWRIIRINGDGSLRIIYDGTRRHKNGISNEDRLAYKEKAFNAKDNDTKYAGWMYGGIQGEASISKEQAQTNETNSNIKTLVDSWYKTNIVDKNLGDRVADVIFCNDRSTPGRSLTNWSDDTGLGYAKNYTAYGITSRIGGPWQTILTQPSFKCPQKNDAFTVSDEELGNGDLTYPVGLITADEVVAAGSGKYDKASPKYYLYKGLRYWLLSPGYFNGIVYSFIVQSGGTLHYYGVKGTALGVAPVINLKPEYVKTLIGDGTINNPYREDGTSI